MQRLFIGEECSLPLYPRGKDESIDFTGFLHASDGQFTWDFGLFSMPYKALQYGYFRRASHFPNDKRKRIPDSAIPANPAFNDKLWRKIKKFSSASSSFTSQTVIHISNLPRHFAGTIGQRSSLVPKILLRTEATARYPKSRSGRGTSHNSPATKLRNPPRCRKIWITAADSVRRRPCASSTTTLSGSRLRTSSGSFFFTNSP